MRNVDPPVGALVEEVTTAALVIELPRNRLEGVKGEGLVIVPPLMIFTYPLKLARRLSDTSISFNGFYPKSQAAPRLNV